MVSASVSVSLVNQMNSFFPELFYQSQEKIARALVCVSSVRQCLVALSSHCPSECLLSTFTLWLPVLPSLQSPSCHGSLGSIIAGHSARLHVWVLPLFLLLSYVDRCLSLLSVLLGRFLSIGASFCSFLHLMFSFSHYSV